MKKATPSRTKPTWKRVLKPAIYIAVGLVLAFPVFSISYYTMVRTSTPQFCETQ